MRGATPSSPSQRSLASFQSTHPMRGATSRGRISGNTSRHFNPRTPCGVRPAAAAAHFVSRISIHAPHAGCDSQSSATTMASSMISIHAPHAGCDFQLQKRQSSLFQYFNPRTPCGVRLKMTLSEKLRALFQSTHPMRGATAPSDASAIFAAFQSTHPMRGATQNILTAYAIVGISIHAPHAGCDMLYAITHMYILTKFQSTHPMRGATTRRKKATTLTDISIHAPHAGCDGHKGHHLCYRCRISIHAPHAGCDRLIRSLTLTISSVFQSTHLMRGATPDYSALSGLRRISIHAPHAGCDHLMVYYNHQEGIISIHAPHAGCDIAAVGRLIDLAISIHAPHAGCDRRLRHDLVQLQHFNPRTPCGVRQAEDHTAILDAISIHAPHAGCDRHKWA